MARQRRSPATSPSPRPSASSGPTPLSGRPRLRPSARAVAMPTRRPVKEPGPIPTAIRSTDSQPPDASAARSTSASNAVVCCGPPFSERPSCASYRTSPSLTAAAEVSAVAVSKPTVISVPLPRNREDEGTDPLALHEPAHPVLTRDIGGDLVDVERPLDRFLFGRAEVFLGRKFDADRVEDVRLVAAEKCALLAGPLADVRRLSVLGQAAGDVVLECGTLGRTGSGAGQQRNPQPDRRQRLQSPHSALPFFGLHSRAMLQGGIPPKHAYLGSDALPTSI